MIDSRSMAIYPH